MVGMSKAKAEKKPLPRRFYAAANAVRHDAGFVVQLDGKNVRTPMQQLLHTTSEKLAQQIAAEWGAQKDLIDTDTMPLTRLLNIALDRVEGDRAALLADIANYIETDLLFYRASVTDAALPIASEHAKLRALQLQHFDPVLEWVAHVYAAAFRLTDGLMPVPQPEDSVHKIAALFAAANDHELAALAMLVPILGSALLTLAVWKHFRSIEEALAAAHLDETVQADAWGQDAEVTAKWAGKCRDAKAAAMFLAAANA